MKKLKVKNYKKQKVNKKYWKMPQKKIYKYQMFMLKNKQKMSKNKMFKYQMFMLKNNQKNNQLLKKRI